MGINYSLTTVARLNLASFRTSFTCYHWMQYAHPPSPPLPASLLNTHSRPAQQHSTFFTLTYYWPLVSPGRSAVGVFLCFFVMLMTNWSCAGLVRLNAKLGELGGAGAGLMPYVV